MYDLTKNKEFYINEFKSNADKLLLIVKGGMYPPIALLRRTNLIKTSQVSPREVQQLKIVTTTLNILVEFIAEVIGITEKIDGVMLGYWDIRKLLQLENFPTLTEEVALREWYLYYWQFLHYSSIILYFNRSQSLWDKFEYIFYLFYHLLPCGICVANFQAKPRKELILNFRVDIIDGMFRFHNMVTESKGAGARTMEFSDFLNRYNVTLRSGHIE